MNSDNPHELLPIVDEQGNVTGTATRSRCHGGSMLLHPVVHLHVLDRQGRIYLQHRPVWKDIQPDRWDTAVGGHIDPGEDVMTALRREAREELGLTEFEPIKVAQYVFESPVERELVYAFTTVTETPPRPTDELDGGRFWSLDEVRRAIGTDILTPCFQQEFIRIFGS